ncbi:MAG TPA: CbiX/SirB N-terminal domain-containing protein [Paracoccaceae bacterium]|mgnify:CR=1 FL=1|uniref:sirohydrochlorin chelatase n=1 Tax=Hydrogenophaga sp. TaxID=1904254 RepID=UPI002C837926|nr:CbiX/SirB N-terminal domain-containing protein [Hydrogenophaga sp.]HMO06080.1 CbiX/SirB N-terminal domain-containing protein [Paracoccaceae bacterium]HMP10663.1 CbiX/SirB N-terminal domain-containing protein [Hydrogenophaga sp.]
MQGIIVFAHGSRDPLWRQPVEAVARAIATRDPQVQVRCAYLELCEPDLPVAAEELVATGVRHVRVLPLFFGMGKHAREDLPLLLLSMQLRHPGVTFERLPAAGEDPRLTDLLARIALEPLP